MMSRVPRWEIDGGNYPYTGISQPDENSWGGEPALGPIPGAMSPVAAVAYTHSDASTPPITHQPKDDGWQGTTTQKAQHFMPLRSRDQPTVRSTVTEISQQGSPLALSPGSHVGVLPNDSVGTYVTPPAYSP